ncbi:MAG: TonB-dependent receptor [Prevotellaceae bacterium]|jgi:hypothetical protein|nr:TonB-dependent receptor [Prevotellaceae bacterium]
MKKILILLALFILPLSATAFSLSGTVRDAENGETLIGATIKVVGKTTTATSNEYGFYSISLPQGKHQIIFDSFGYRSDTLHITLDANLHRDIALRTHAEQLQELVVSSVKNNDNVVNSQSGVQRMDIKEINRLPVLFGEKDIIKSVQLLPGVKSSGDGSGSIFVRGGAGDQNLILLDEATVYNASHLMGFFSTFNSDAIKDLSLYKGTQPAQYGGRLSSAMDIRMKEGNNEQMELNGSLGLISSKLSIEAPIKRGKSSFLVSGRRTYADVFLMASDKYRGTKLYFYDLNLKANYRFSNRDALFVSGYFGRDKLGLKDIAGIDWGNATGTLRWNHIFSSKLFSNTSLIVSNYKYEVLVNFSDMEFEIKSVLTDYNFKQEFQYYAGEKHALRFGLDVIYHEILPGEVSGSGIITRKLQNQRSVESALFISDEWKLSKRLSINAGARLSGFSVLGGDDFYRFNAEGELLETTYYNRSDIVKNYFTLEPRLNSVFVINDANSLKASYTRNAQYLHLLSTSTSSSPMDKWFASDNNVRPSTANQYSLGYFRNLKKNAYETSVELYYKTMANLVDYRDGADIVFNDLVASQLLSGVGRAYGAEFFIKKKTGKLTGWISYTLSRSEKKIEGINNGRWYVARQDKTHDIAIAASYDLNRKVNLSAAWVYSTGNAVTFPSGKYSIDDKSIWLYTERNGYRMPAYHRLDLSVNIKLKQRKHYESELSIGLYNAYGHENAYAINFEENPDDPNRTQAVQTSLFRWVPSVAWNFKIK